MKIWHYHRTTKELLCEGIADRDSMVPGEFLVPAFATKVKPPALKKHQIALFTGSSWEVKADWRGVPLYGAGEAAQPRPMITKIGDTPAAMGLTAEPPPPLGDHQVAVFDGKSWEVKADWRSVPLYGPGEASRGRVERITQLGVTPEQAGLSDTEPPEAKEREVATLVDGSWRVVPDWRGVKLYHKRTRSRVIIEKAGKEPDFELLTELEPPSTPSVFEDGKWVPDVNALREQRWKEVKAERERRQQMGGVQVDNNWFNSDTLSRTRYIGQMQRGESYVNDIRDWRTMNGNTVTMSASLAGRILAACTESDVALDKAAQEHRSALQECADPLNYDITAGWPSAYGA